MAPIPAQLRRYLRVRRDVPMRTNHSGFASRANLTKRDEVNMSVSRNGLEIGAWTEAEVRRLCAEGKLLPTDNYWREGMGEWEPLGTFIEQTTPTQSEAVSRPSIQQTAQNRRQVLKNNAGYGEEVVIKVKSLRRGLLFVLFTPFIASLIYLLERHAYNEKSITIVAYSIVGLMLWCAAFLKSEARLSRIILLMITAGLISFLVLDWLHG